MNCEEPKPISKEEAEVVFSGEDTSAIFRALVNVVFHADD